MDIKHRISKKTAHWKALIQQEHIKSLAKWTIEQGSIFNLNTRNNDVIYPSNIMLSKEEKTMKKPISKQKLIETLCKMLMEGNVEMAPKAVALTLLNFKL